MSETEGKVGDTPDDASKAQVPSTEEQIRAANVGELVPLAGPILIVDYNPEWPTLYKREAEWVQSILGERVLLLEHVGSTSVPGLAAKPRIDMLLFRDWLCSNESDRLVYERTKRELALKDWKYIQNYADAKSQVVEEVLARARGQSHGLPPAQK